MNILTGLPRETTKGAGGIAKIYLAKISDVTNVTIDPETGEVSFESTADAWKEIGLSQQTGTSFTETGTGTVGTQTFYTDQALTINLN